MRTVQVTLEDELVESVDRVVKGLHTTRSAFTREALRRALKDLRARQLEEKHRAGYARRPPRGGEFSVWEPEQSWGDE